MDESFARLDDAFDGFFNERTNDAPFVIVVVIFIFAWKSNFYLFLLLHSTTTQICGARKKPLVSYFRVRNEILYATFRIGEQVLIHFYSPVRGYDRHIQRSQKVSVNVFLRADGFGHMHGTYRVDVIHNVLLFPRVYVLTRLAKVQQIRADPIVNGVEDIRERVRRRR